jgi:hypothetical protein
MNRADEPWDEACDRWEEVFDRVEALLDGGELAEALRLLRQNEAELRQWARPEDGATRVHEGERSAAPGTLNGVVVVSARPDYAPMSVRTTRLPVLLHRTGSLLSRCEGMRDRTADELRRLQTSRSFRSDPPAAGTWFTEEA